MNLRPLGASLLLTLTGCVGIILDGAPGVDGAVARTPDTGVRMDMRTLDIDVPPGEDAGNALPGEDAGAPPRADTGVRPPNNCPTGPAVATQAVPAFPGAEGFGATATGGRGGGVCVVSNLNPSGAGSLGQCLQTRGARFVVFRVSGVINGPLNITQGNLTVAGQTSPGGVTVRGGLRCDNVYDPNDCRNVILRHLRLRGGDDDTLRLSGAQRVIADHMSFANARDELVEISRAQDITLQHSVIAEPVGDHYLYGGVLINYSKDRFPLANISLHHNVWNGVHGRLPEISCEENGDGPGTTNCAGRRLRIDVSHNVMFDVGDPVYYNRCVGINEGNDCAASARNFLLDLNFVGNLMFRRRTFNDRPMFVNEVSRNTANVVFYTDNLLSWQGRTIAAALALPSRGARLDMPAITATPSGMLVAQLQRSAGAFPRDEMDRRLANYLSAAVDSRPAAWSGGNGVDRGDAFRVTTAPAAPADSDGDGMPDAWERAHGLRPDCPGASLGTLAANPANGVPGCASGYTDLECYLNELSAQRIAGM
jgi:pectate lyase